MRWVRKETIYGWSISTSSLSKWDASWCRIAVVLGCSFMTMALRSICHILVLVPIHVLVLSSSARTQNAIAGRSGIGSCWFKASGSSFKSPSGRLMLQWAATAVASHFLAVWQFIVLPATGLPLCCTNQGTDFILVPPPEPSWARGHPRGSVWSCLGSS